MKKKRNGTWKQPVASVLGMGLVVGLTIVGTLAFMYTKSNTKTNVFTGTNDIKLYLEEPNYNLAETKNADGIITYTVKDDKKLDPREYVPGETYPKDPTLYNITGKQNKKYTEGNQTIGEDEYAEEWVAMKVEYTLNGSTTNYNALTVDTVYGDDGKTVATQGTGIIEPIDFDEEILESSTTDGKTTYTVKEPGNWIRIPSNLISGTPNYDIFIYKYKLKATEAFNENTITSNSTTYTSLNSFLNKLTVSTGVVSGTDTTGNGVKTTPLFSQIVIKDLEQLQKNGYQVSDLKKFEIKLTGAAIKVMTTNDLNEISQQDILAGADANGVKQTSLLIVEDLVSLLQQ